MSLNLPDRGEKTFSLRLACWFTSVSLLAFIILSVLAYFSLSISLEKEDRKPVVEKSLEYAEAYNGGELYDVELLIASERDSGKPVPFFVRLATASNRTLLLSIPDKWAGVDPQQIKNVSVTQKVQKFRVKVNGHESIFEIISSPLDDGTILQIGSAIERREELLAHFKKIFVSVMIPAILISLIGGYAVIYHALQPIRHLTQTVRTVIDTGGLEARVPLGRSEDELNGLVVLVNIMLERIEKLVIGMRESHDNVAHELRTPITRLRSIAENALQMESDAAACREALSDCLEESERIARLITALMDISEAKAGLLKLNIEQVDISAVIRDVLELYRYPAEDKSIILHATFSGVLKTAADPDRIRQVVANLLDNAVKYTPTGGSIYVEAYQSEKHVFICVRDTGIGINQEDLPKIWDRLYRGDDSGSQRGLGLGLSIARSIVEIHGGLIRASSEPGAGTTFTVSLPSHI